MKTDKLVRLYNKLYNGPLTIIEAISVLNITRCKSKSLRAFYKSNNGYKGRVKKYYLTAFKYDK